MKRIIISLIGFGLGTCAYAAVTTDEVHIPTGQQKTNDGICHQICLTLNFQSGIRATSPCGFMCKCTNGPKASVPSLDDVAQQKR